MPEKYEHHPGSPQAIADGCTCPDFDNSFGAGCGYVNSDGETLYWFNSQCPLHGGVFSEEVAPESLCFPTCRQG